MHPSSSEIYNKDSIFHVRVVKTQKCIFSPPVYYFSLVQWVLQLFLQTNTYTYLSHRRINKENFQKSFKNF